MKQAGDGKTSHGKPSHGKPSRVWHGAGTEREDGVNFLPQSGRGHCASNKLLYPIPQCVREGGEMHWQIMACVEELVTAGGGFGGARKIRVDGLIKFWEVFKISSSVAMQKF